MSDAVKQPEVGDEIFTECGKCKSEMYHVITAIKDGEIKKVMCKGCNTTHLYKDKTTKKKKKAAKTGAGNGLDAKPKKRRRRIRKYDWDALSAELEEDDLVDYQLDIDLTEARGIKHKSFGIGVVTKVISEKQIEVLFQEELKILVHNYEMQTS